MNESSEVKLNQEQKPPVRNNLFLYLAIFLFVAEGVLGVLGFGGGPLLLFGALIAFTLWATKPKSKTRWIIVSILGLLLILLVVSIFESLSTAREKTEATQAASSSLPSAR